MRESTSPQNQNRFLNLAICLQILSFHEKVTGGIMMSYFDSFPFPIKNGRCMQGKIRLVVYFSHIVVVYVFTSLQADSNTTAFRGTTWFRRRR